MLLLKGSLKMKLRHLYIILLLSTGSASVMSVELWAEIYNARLAEAQQGSADAQFEIGAMYENGRGVTADRAEAIQWYQKAAAQNHDRAVHAVARMEDSQRRLEVAQSQAESGDVEAQYKLGTMYLTGTGTTTDLQLAAQWLTRAAEKNHTKAQFKLGHLFYVKLTDEGDMQSALNWFNKAAANNYSPAFYYLGDMYASGSGVTKDYDKAREWYEKARSAGFSPAVQALSDLDDRRKQDERRKQEAEHRMAAEEERKAAEAKSQQLAKEATSTAKQEPEPATPENVLERLQLGQWLDKKRPVQFLPSKISECTSDTSSLTCYSRELARKDLPQVHYKVKSIIRAAGNDSLKIVYRELVLKDLTVDADAEDAELLLDTGIPPGWQEPHSLNCKFTAAQQLTCTTDDGSVVKFTGA
jgi:TPR repeat protein